MNLSKRCFFVAVFCLAMFGLLPDLSAQPAKTQKNLDQMIEAAVNYCKSTQAEDGTWSKANNPGITGLVLGSLLHTGRVFPGDPTATKALKFIESLVNEKEGHIAGASGKQTNYLTTVNLMALKATNQKKYDTIIANATAFLKSIQIEDVKDKEKDASYGGIGYGAGTRPDLSNTHFFLDALITAGVPKSDPAFKKALIFVSRCQNVKSEFNDQPWAEKINDGSFIYVLATPGKAKTPPDTPRPGYGSMTFAGLKALKDCGVTKDDIRYKKALEWAGKHYTVKENPGRAAGQEQGGYYVYLALMTSCLNELQIDEIVDAAGQKHNWRAEVVEALATRQQKDGSWVNESKTWQENNPHVATAFALEALRYCQLKAK